MSKFNEIYVGLDVHKATIAVAIVRGVRGTAFFYGEIENTPQAVAKLVKALSQEGDVLHFFTKRGRVAMSCITNCRPLGTLVP